MSTPNDKLPLLSLCEEVKALYASNTGQYVHTIEELAAIDAGLVTILAPRVSLDEYAAAWNSLDVVARWLVNGNDPIQAAAEVRLNLARMRAPRPLPPLGFWVTSQDDLKRLSPMEMLFGAPLPSRPHFYSTQQRLLALPIYERLDRIYALYDKAA